MGPEFFVGFDWKINVFCMVINGILLFKSVRSIDRRQSHMLYVHMLGALGVFLVFDFLWGMINDGLPVSSRAFGALVNYGYFISLDVSAFLWFSFAESLFGSSITQKPKLWLCTALPLVVLIALVLLSPFTGVFFILDEHGHYVDSPALHLRQEFLLFFYVGIAAVRALYKAFQKENYARRRRLLVIVWFSLPVFLVGMLQEHGMPVLCLGTTLSALLVYMSTQETLISLDPLTGMNNRSQLLNYLSRRMRAPQELYLLILDVDRFKQINDRFGHVEGDRALVAVANALRRVCARFGCFGARYGGDEFVLVYEPGDAAVTEINYAVHTELEAENQRLGARGYRIDVSIGCARYDERFTDIPSFIAEADQQLYQVKAVRRALHSA